MPTATQMHPLYERLSQAADKAAAEHDRVCAAVQGAIDDVSKRPSKDLDTMTGQFDDLLRAQGLLPGAFERVAAARGAALDAAYDNGAVALHKPQILAAIQQVAKWKRSLSEASSRLESFLDAHDRQLGRQQSLDDAYSEVVGAFRKLSLEAQARFDQRGPAIVTCHAAARDAADERRLKDLKSLQQRAQTLAMDDLFRDVGTMALLLQQCADLNGRAGKESRLAHVQEHGRARGRLEAIKKGLPDLQRRLDEVAALQVAPLDVPRALKALGLRPGSGAALASALAGTPEQCAKRLGELAVRAGSPSTGRQMWSMLKKAGVV